MIDVSRGVALSTVCAAVTAGLFLVSTPAAAKRNDRLREIEVGPIWNQKDAEAKCPKAARQNGGTWTGQWRTTRVGQMSVCEISVAGEGGGVWQRKLQDIAERRRSGREIEVGPIWNQADAEVKCPKAARSAGGTWTGQWRTIRPGQMSVCEISMTRSGWVRMIEVGPIWNQADAEVKCRKAASAARGTWTGQWRTTRPGKMSVCEVAQR